MTRTPRRAGARWRILAHTIEPHGRYGDSHHVASDRRLGGGTGEDTSVEADGRTFWARHTELPGTELDEVVLGRFLHLEQMSSGRWWLDVGGVVLWVDADRDGRPRSVSVFGPGTCDRPVPGVAYSLDWNDTDPQG